VRGGEGEGYFLPVPDKNSPHPVLFEFGFEPVCSSAAPVLARGYAPRLLGLRGSSVLASADKLQFSYVCGLKP
jgi:hypothetical protein